jgi:hypothetical protein
MQHQPPGFLLDGRQKVTVLGIAGIDVADAALAKMLLAMSAFRRG